MQPPPAPERMAAVNKQRAIVSSQSLHVRATENWKHALAACAFATGCRVFDIGASERAIGDCEPTFGDCIETTAIANSHPVVVNVTSVMSCAFLHGELDG